VAVTRLDRFIAASRLQASEDWLRIAFSKAHLNGDKDLEIWKLVEANNMRAAFDLAEGGSASMKELEAWSHLVQFLSEFDDTIRAVLSIQASSAPCERVFSEAGAILADRSTLSIAALEESIRLRKSVRSEHTSVESYRAFVTRTALGVLRARGAD